MKLRFDIYTICFSTFWRGSSFLVAEGLLQIFHLVDRVETLNDLLVGVEDLSRHSSFVDLDRVKGTGAAKGRAEDPMI